MKRLLRATKMMHDGNSPSRLESTGKEDSIYIRLLLLDNNRTSFYLLQVQTMSKSPMDGCVLDRLLDLRDDLLLDLRDGCVLDLLLDLLFLRDDRLLSHESPVYRPA